MRLRRARRRLGRRRRAPAAPHLHAAQATSARCAPPGAAPCRPRSPSRDYDVVVFENRFPSYRRHRRRADAPDRERHLRHAARPSAAARSSASPATTSRRSPTSPVERVAHRHRRVGRPHRGAGRRSPEVEQVFCFENRGQRDRRDAAPPARPDLRLPLRPARTQPLLDAGRRPPRAHRPAPRRRHPRRRARPTARGSSSRATHWTAYVPFAARWPVEVHLAPHRDVPDLAALDDDERDELADVYLRPARPPRPLLRRRGRRRRSRCPTSPAGTRRPAKTGRDVSRLHLQVMSVLRAPGQAEVPRRLRVGRRRLGQRRRRRSGSRPGCGRSPRERRTRRRGRRGGAPRRFARTFGSAPDGRVVGARPGQPHRRAHRLQRRAVPADRACRSARMPPLSPARRRHRADGVRAAATASSSVALDDVAPGQPGGWARLRRRRAVGAAAGRPGRRRSRRRRRLARVPLGRRAVQLGRARVRRRGGAERPVRPRPAGGPTTGRARLAALCVEAENVIAGAPTGGMDQSASLLCERRPRAAARLPRRLESQQVPFDLAAHELALLVIDTRAEHAPRRRPVRARRRDACEQAARELGVADAARDRPVRPSTRRWSGSGPTSVRRRVRHVVTEIERVRATVAAPRGRGPVDEVGPLFDASHALAARRLRGLRARARRRGGDGRGARRARRPDDRRRVRRLGIALVPAGAVEAVSEAVTKAFADHGFPARPASRSSPRGRPAGTPEPTRSVGARRRVSARGRARR